VSARRRTHTGAVGPGGGSGTVSVETDPTCAWTAVSGDAWITVTSGSPGSGDGSVDYSVAVNSGAVRTGTSAIAGETFVVDQQAALRTLTVATAGAGSGTVGGIGISCAPDCVETYDHGTSVRLTAIPGAGSAFVGWRADCTGTAESFDLTMDADKSCVATFEPATVAIATRSKVVSGSFTALPSTSSINYVVGQTRANNAVASLDGLGRLAAHCSQAVGSVHFVLDVNGYFQ
jgi:Divergent InlB B-repeat domain